VGLAAYAAAAIARSDPITTGIQGFTYDLRTAILPFVFLFNTELLMIAGVGAGGEVIWLDSILKIGWVFVVALAAMFAFASFMQGYAGDHCSWFERILLLILAIFMFRPGIVEDLLPVTREIVQAVCLAAYGGFYFLQKTRRRLRDAQEAA